MVHDLDAVGEQGGDRVGIPRGEGGLEAVDVRGRGVRAYSARAPLGAWGWHRRKARRRRLGRQLVEAGERLVGGVDVEELEARLEAVGSEDAELESVLLEFAAACPIGARERRTPEDGVGACAEDVVDADGDM